ncbi:MerR family transcriptional regulator [Edaphovirga cremea]|uniref:MerR family transcriptional regulator n=1 Tax=Edaphovirga cremea TaxID=2267246 RepID=UPI0039898747
MTLYSIGEITSICGINPVTLRAWQRRYGLIKPQRTEGGHRLYSEDDLSRIRTILSWLNRGVPIGQIRALLDGDITEPETVSIHASDRLLEALQLSNTDKLRAMLRDLGKDYPTRALVDTILRPLRQRLGGGGSQLLTMRALLDGVIIEYVSFCLNAGRKTRGPKAIMIAWGQIDRTELWLEALKWNEEGARVDVMQESLAAPYLQGLKAQHLVLWAEGRLTQVQRQQFLAWQVANLPVMLRGSAVRLTSFATSEIEEE